MSNSIVLIAELLGVEVQVVFEVFSACEAAVEYLIRFIRALGIPPSVQAVIRSVPGVDTSHILTCAS